MTIRKTVTLVEEINSEYGAPARVPLRRVGGRRMIVGRSGKFIRRQLWGRLVVTELASPEARLSSEPDTDLPDR